MADSKLGLVLSGGGAKGAYQIGVYYALKRLGKIPDIITGTSVGALNGAILVQKDYHKAMKLWKTMSFSKVYDETTFSLCENPAIADVYKMYVKSFITEGGMDVGKLKGIFDKLYNSRKFFASKIDYGLVTYNLSQNKPVFKTKKDLSPDNVKDYVIASASCYPAFKPQKIDNDLYIDGGYYDNLPINLAIKLGAEEIIAVDLKAVGFKRPVKTSIPITTISPRNKIVSFLVFDKLKSQEALRFGYNDTMKTFKHFDGNEFTFKKHNLIKNYNRYGKIFEQKVYEILKDLDSGIIGKITSSSIFKSIVKEKVSYKYFNNLVEEAGKCFNFAEDTLYNIRTFNKGLLVEMTKTNAVNLKTITAKIKNRKFKGIIERKSVVKLFYEMIKENNMREAFVFLPVFADEFLIALYLYVIRNKSIIKY